MPFDLDQISLAPHCIVNSRDPKSRHFPHTANILVKRHGHHRPKMGQPYALSSAGPGLSVRLSLPVNQSGPNSGSGDPERPIDLDQGSDASDVRSIRLSKTKEGLTPCSSVMPYSLR